MKKIQIIIIAFLISLSICAFASMQARAALSGAKYDLKFAVSGLDSSAQGPVVSVTVGATSVNLVQNQFPYDFGSVNAGTTISYTFTSTVASSNSGKQFVLTTPAATPASGFTLTGATTVTGTYETQYLVTFSSSGLGPDANADGLAYFLVTNGQYSFSGPFNLSPLPPIPLSGGSIWVDSGATVTYNFVNPVTSSNTGEQYRLNSTAGPASGFTVSGPTTLTGNYVAQYQVTFAQTGLNLADASGNLVTYTVTNGQYSGTPSPIPLSGGSIWVDNGASITYSFANIVASNSGGKQYRLNSTIGPGSPFYPAPSFTLTGNYVTQYMVTFSSSGLGADATGGLAGFQVTGGLFSGPTNPLPPPLPPIGVSGGSIWVDAGANVTYNFVNTVTSSNTGEQYRLNSITGTPSPITDLSGSTTLIGNYVTQYQVTLVVSGLDGSAQGTLVSVTGGVSAPVTFTESQLPVSGYVDAGTTISYTFTPTVASSNSGEQFVLTTPAATPASGFTLTGATTVTGTYETQYQLSVTASPAGASTGSFMATYTVGGTTYTSQAEATPWTQWVDAGTTVTLSGAQTPITIGTTRYVFASYSEAFPYTMNSAHTITLTYNTQYQVTFVVSPSGSESTSPAGTNVWENAGSLSISATANTGYSFSTWSSNTGSITFNNANSASTTATISGPGTITGNFLAAPTLTSTAPSKAVAGTIFTDSATLTGATSNAGGTVTYTLYSGVSPNGALVGSVNTPVSGNGVYISGSFTVKTAGQYYFSAVYSGDSNNNGATASAEAFTVGKASPSLSTTAPVYAVAGAGFVDSATLTGTSGSNAGGPVTYTLYKGTYPSGTQVGSSSVVTVTGGVVPNSASFTVTTAGSYYFSAVYSGDNNNNGASSAVEAFTVNHSSAVCVTVLPASATITAGGSQAFTATDKDAYGNTWVVTSSVTWSISAGADGSVSAGGVATATKVGTWTVKAVDSAGNVGTASLTVTHGSAVSIAVSPVSATIKAGSTETYKATATDAYGNSWDVTGSVTWSISCGAGGSWCGATYTSAKAGSWTVTARLDGVSGTASLTVTHACLDHFVCNTVGGSDCLFCFLHEDYC